MIQVRVLEQLFLNYNPTAERKAILRDPEVYEGLSCMSFVAAALGWTAEETRGFYINKPFRLVNPVSGEASQIYNLNKFLALHAELKGSASQHDVEMASAANIFIFTETFTPVAKGIAATSIAHIGLINPSNPNECMHRLGIGRPVTVDNLPESVYFNGAIFQPMIHYFNAPIAKTPFMNLAI